MSRLVNGWRGFWKDFNSNQEWIFPELPPTQLQKSSVFIGFYSIAVNSFGLNGCGLENRS